MLERRIDQGRLEAALGRAPVVLLTGPRQAGKSTLARHVAGAPPERIYDLEDPRDLARLENPTLALGRTSELVVIDEAQRLPALFPIMRVLVDEDRRPGRFLVLGSASPDLVGLAAESLAGRVTLLELPGLRVADVGSDRIDDLWRRGGLPPAYLADDEESSQWRDDYITTFLERDLANLGMRTPPTTMRRFWTMVAHYHGQTWNGAELARALAVSQPTVRHYVDALTDALVVRQLIPWHANLAKRQVRSPKIYVRDTGLLHRLLGITTSTDLLRHPKVGASWEGFVVEQLVSLLDLKDPAFWATHAGAELDLFATIGSRRLGFEIKRTDRPSVTPSIRSALASLGLDHVYVVTAGTMRAPLADKVTAIPAADLLTQGAAALDEA